MLSALLALSLSARAEPPPLYAPEAVSPPSTEAAVALVGQLQQACRQDGPQVGWLEEHVRPAQLPAPPPPEWYEQLALSLGPSGTLGQALVEAEISHTSLGPDYVRVVLSGDRPLTVVVRGADPPRIDHLALSTCSLCEEPVRFVRDLLDEIRAPGSSAPRLIPGVDLHVRGAQEEQRSLRGVHWPAYLLRRNGRDPSLSAVLEGAVVDSAQGREVRVRLADGRVDPWTITWVDARWQVDYQALAPDSPLRLESWEARRWRDPSTLRRVALARWSPSWETREGAVQVGHHVVGAAFRPLQEDLVVVTLDPDRERTGVFVVDPWTRRVTARWPLPVSEATQLPVPHWYTRWRVALSPQGDQVAVGGPGRVWVVRLDTGARRQLTKVRELTTLTWTERGLVVAEARGALSLWTEEGMRWVVALPEPAVSVGDGERLVVVSRQGGVMEVDPATGATTQLGRACCDRVLDAALAPTGDELLVGCDATCPTAAERWDLLGAGGVSVLQGAGSPHRGVSWSPDGLWLTTGGPQAAPLLWDAHDEVVVGTLGQAAAEQVIWSPRADQVVVVDDQGEAWLWTPSPADHAGL